MLEKYAETQPILYKILNNSIIKSKNVHAYLFETNNNKDAYNIINDFCKALLCPHKLTQKRDCVNCTQCKKIDNGNFLDLKIIECDGSVIKKEQVDNLQKQFSNVAIESEYMIYVIKEAEKMTSSASNSILKFLEEPENNIIAILVTSNKKNMLSTIVSRCQVISMKNELFVDQSIYQLVGNLCSNTIEQEQQFFQNDEIETKFQTVYTFVNNLESSTNKALINESRVYNMFFKEKQDISLFYNIVLAVYELKLKKKNFDLNIFFKSNDINYICKKIEIVLEYKALIEQNFNSNLLLDKFIIDMGMVKC